jgi:hypothetical protein
MADLPGGDDALARIHRRFAKPVRYTGAGLTYATIWAVRSHGPAGFVMDDQSPRQLTFEIRKADLPGIPNEGDKLVESDGHGKSWSVIEYLDLDDVDAWRVTVKAA